MTCECCPRLQALYEKPSVLHLVNMIVHLDSNNKIVHSYRTIKSLIAKTD